MTELHEPWKNVASKAEALGLKLKLHLEQERDESDESAEPGDTKAAIEDFGKRLQDAFDSFGVAAKDPAVRADFKDIGSLVKDAITDTFSNVSTEVGDVMKKATKRGAAEESASGGDDPQEDTVTDS